MTRMSKLAKKVIIIKENLKSGNEVNEVNYGWI